MYCGEGTVDAGESKVLDGETPFVGCEAMFDLVADSPSHPSLQDFPDCYRGTSLIRNAHPPRTTIGP